MSRPRSWRGRKRPPNCKKKVSVDDEIPNLFFGFPRPEASSATVASAASSGAAKPADTNFYVWDDSSDRARVQEDEVKRGPSPGTKFVAKYATPNEVVSRAAALDGVAGALIALPDGLMVASRLSPRTSMATRWRRSCPKSSAKSTNAPKSCGWAN